MMSNKKKSRIRQYGCLLLFSILCVVFLAAPVRAADSHEDIDVAETTKTNVTAKPQSEVVKAAWYEDSYHITDKNGSRSGYGYEYEQAVSAYTGWDYDYVTGNWEELLKKLQNDEIDLMSSLSYTDERAKTMLFSDLPMGEEKYYLYADLANSDISASDISSLNGQSIAMMENSVQTTQFYDWEKKYNVKTKHVFVNSMDSAMEMFAKFDSFSRERNTTVGKVAGTGLGMAIVKKYVDLMGGSIDVKSELGKGTVFTLILIQKKADENYYGQKASKTDAADMESSLCGKHILLAEDNDLNAEIAIAILEETGLIIDRVEDGVQCVDRIEQMPAGTYDMILMDIQMPNMDGYEATKCIRHLQDIKKAEIPIIAMTANAFQEDAEKCIAVGMNAHLAKPLDIEKVEQTICKQVRDAKMKNRI